MDAITYAMSKKYTDSKVTESSGLHREIVNSLPSTGDNSTIYMVLDPNASSPDVYDEWLWVNGAYEHIGSTRVDLSDYYNKTQVDTALSGKANTATTLAGYGITDAYTKTEVDTALNKLDKYWKLDAGTVIPDNSNLNDYKTPGNYYHLTSNVSTISNIPDNKGFRLTVLLDLYDPEYVEQIFNPIGSYKTYKRYYNTYHTWTDWAVVEDDLSSKAGAFSIDTFLNTSSFSIPSHDTYGFNMDISKSGRTAIAIMGILGADGRKLTGLSIADFYISHPNPHSTESRILIDFYNGSNSTVSIRENGIEFTILYSEGLLGD